MKQNLNAREVRILTTIAAIGVAAAAIISIAAGILVCQWLAPWCTNIRDGAVPLFGLLFTAGGGTYAAYTYVPQIVRKAYLAIRHFFTTLLK